MIRKVIMYTPAKLFEGNLTGGIKRFLELYRGLMENGVDVILFSSDEPETLFQEGIKNRSISYVDPSLKFWIPSILKSFIANFRTINEIKKMEYDSLIVFDVPTALNFCVLGAINVDLFIRQDLISYKAISIKERTSNKIMQNIYLKLISFSESICMRRARKIIVQCKYDKSQLYNRHKRLKEELNKKLITQINNVNPSWISQKSTNDYKRDQNNKYKICFVGDFNNERKGQKIFIDAIINLLDKGEDIEAILIGGGKNLDFYKKRYNDYLNIKFVGRLENPIEIMKDCDLMVVPSLADSCPNTVMEALYNEIPVIGANSGGIPEILSNSNALFETNSISLQKKIEYYLDKDNLTKLREQQKMRKQELAFDWPGAIIKHLRLN